VSRRPTAVRRPAALEERRTGPPAILVVDHWFEREGDLFTSASEPRPATLARRYLDTFDSLLVLGRCRSTRPGTLLHGRDTGGRRVDLLVTTRVGGPLGAVLAVPHLVQALRRHRSEVVVLNGPGMLGMLTSVFGLRGRAYGIEVVGFVRETLETARIRWPLPQLGEWLTKRAVRRAAAASFVTRDALQERYRARSKTITSAYSSIELPGSAVRATPRPVRDHDGPVRVVSVTGLYQRDKGVDVLIEAARLLRGRGRDFTLSIVGDGPLLGEATAQVEAAGLTEVVTFVGHLPGPPAVMDFLDSADVYVLPSLSEGLPRALIEAMARGLPCVSTAVGGIPEVLDDEWLVPAGDPAALAEALGRAVDDPAAAARAGARNLEVARGYAIEVLKPRRDAFYRELARVSGHG
jgi:phosphatidylinositol alpha-1,6-mannosyltransferase